MLQKYARYPFLEGAKDEIENFDTSIHEVFYDPTDEDVNPSETAIAIRKRALERVQNAVNNYYVGCTDDNAPKKEMENEYASDYPTTEHEDPVVELLSYPVARVFVSAVGESSLISRYTTAEAKTAKERMLEDINIDNNAKEWKKPDGLVSRTEMMEEFGLDDIEEERATDNQGILFTKYKIKLIDYLPLTTHTWGDEWDLVNRSPSNGVLTINKGEVDELLQAAIKKRVKDGENNNSSLPVHVDEPLMETITGNGIDGKPLEVDAIMQSLRDKDLITEIDAVVPDLFPPCMKKLLSMLKNGKPLDHHSRIALGTFLINIGMSTDEIIGMMEVHPDFDEGARYHINHLRGETGPVQYDVPSCATMKTYGDCYNPDDVCDTIKHPMAYYEKTLDDTDADDYTDWREQNAEKEEMTLDETGDVPVFNPGSGGSETATISTETKPVEPEGVAEDRDDSDSDIGSFVNTNDDEESQDDDEDVEVFDPSSL